MQFEYKYCIVSLSFLTIEYPVYPYQNGQRAVLVWQLTIDDFQTKIVKGNRDEIIKKIKYHIDNMDSDDLFFVDDDDDCII